MTIFDLSKNIFLKYKLLFNMVKFSDSFELTNSIHDL